MASLTVVKVIVADVEDIPCKARFVGAASVFVVIFNPEEARDVPFELIACIVTVYDVAGANPEMVIGDPVDVPVIFPGVAVAK